MRYFKKTTALVLSITLLMAAGKVLDIQAKEAAATNLIPTRHEAQEAMAVTTVASKLAPEPKPETQPAARIYDIPLADELQEYTFTLCTENGVDYEMVLAMMERESSFKEKEISKTNDYGLMQINKVNHRWLSDELGINDFLDAKQNILAGIHILTGLTQKYGDQNKVLMAYNCGENGAKKLWDKGITSSEYSRAIIARAEELKEE